jgi:hypothetical protein
MQQHALIIAMLSVLSASAVGCGQAAPAAAPQDAKGVEELAAKGEALKGLVPDRTHIMADVGYHFTNLWFAGEAANWPLANFYLAETKSHLRWAVRAKPIRKDDAGCEINLGKVLEAIENSQLTQLKQAIKRKEKPAFESVYRETLTTCYSCHKASDKPYLRPQVPMEPETRVINFNPDANWPL